MKTRHYLVKNAGVLLAVASLVGSLSAATPQSTNNKSDSADYQSDLADGQPATTAANPSKGLWDNGIFGRMQQIQREMNDLFQESFGDAKATSGMNDLFQSNGMHFNTSSNIQEEKDRYVARFYLPDRNMSNVDVKVDKGDNGTTLSITAKEEKSTTNKPSDKEKGADTMASTSYSMSQYQQLVTLPGPVDASKMQVDRKENTVTVTLPKADAAKSDNRVNANTPQSAKTK